MKKFIFPALLLMSFGLLLTSCGGGGGEYVPEEVVSEDTVYPRVSGTPIAVDCTNDLWVCTTQYGSADISTVEYLVGSIQILEMFAGFDTTEAQIDAYLADPSWAGSEVVDEYELDGGEVAVLQGASNNKTKWILMTELDGKTDYSIKCEANVDTDQYDAYKASIEEMCLSARAE